MNSNTKENEMTNSTQELTLAQAYALANKEYPQYRRFTYVRGSEVVVRDNDENIITTYAFIVPVKAQQLTLSF